jgi:endonuclease YncB( thermonuclease family)
VIHARYPRTTRTKCFLSQAPDSVGSVRRLLVCLVLSLSACGGHRVDLGRQSPATAGQEPGGYEVAEVTRVVDGDTVEVLITERSDGPAAGLAEVGETYSVRLIGIDTPESVKPGSPVECFGKEASAAAAALLDGQTVTLVKDVEETDSYERLLRYVYLGEEMANARVIVSLNHPLPSCTVLGSRRCQRPSIPLARAAPHLTSKRPTHSASPCLADPTAAPHQVHRVMASIQCERAANSSQPLSQGSPRP